MTAGAGTVPHSPRRTCIGCRQTRPAGELVRITRDPSGTLRLGRHEPGRGAWLCRRSGPCLEEAVRRRAFERALRGPVAPGAVDMLRDQLQRGIGAGSGSEDVEP